MCVDLRNRHREKSLGCFGRPPVPIFGGGFILFLVLVLPVLLVAAAYDY